jgi:hypothetical protein
MRDFCQSHRWESEGYTSFDDIEKIFKDAIEMSKTFPEETQQAGKAKVSRMMLPSTTSNEALETETAFAIITEAVRVYQMSHEEEVKW